MPCFDKSGKRKDVSICTCGERTPHKNKLYVIRYKGKWETVGGSYKNAEDRLIQLKSMADDAYLGIMSQRRSNITIKVLIEDHYNPHLEEESRRKGTSTYKYEQSRIGIISKEFGSVFIKEVTVGDINLFLRKYRKRDVSEATIDRLITRLKAIYKFAIDNDFIDKNIMQSIRVTNMTNEIERVLDANEIITLLNECFISINPYIYHIVLSAINTCLRSSNLLKLTPRLYDFKLGLVKLPPQFMKNNKIIRLPLSQRYNDVMHKYVVDNNISDDDYLFSMKCFRGAWKGALSRSDISDFRFHDLRHTGATIMIMSGVNIHIVQQILGHKDVRTTQRYIHYGESEARVAIDKIDSFITHVTQQKYQINE